MDWPVRKKYTSGTCDPRKSKPLVLASGPSGRKGSVGGGVAPQDGGTKRGASRMAQTAGTEAGSGMLGSYGTLLRSNVLCQSTVPFTLSIVSLSPWPGGLGVGVGVGLGGGAPLPPKTRPATGFVPTAARNGKQNCPPSDSHTQYLHSGSALQKEQHSAADNAFTPFGYLVVRDATQALAHTASCPAACIAQLSPGSENDDSNSKRTA